MFYDDILAEFCKIYDDAAAVSDKAIHKRVLDFSTVLTLAQ